jgi:hypothetical protein
MFSGEAPISRVSRLIFFLKKFGIFKINPYLCSMKKEFGKWLMDIAKYMVTALLLSTIFADMHEPIIIYMVVIMSVIVLGFGLYWVNEGETTEQKKNKKKK